MITEPEMAGEESGPGPAPDVLSGAEGGGGPGAWARRAARAARGIEEPGEPATRPARRPPWLWALGGAAAACAVGAAVIQGTGYGRTTAPDLHGYRIADSPCTGQNLQPLTDTLGTGAFVADTQSLRKGRTLDHVACSLAGWAPSISGWETTYNVTVTVDLHKKTSPRGEFEDITRLLVPEPTPTPAVSGGLVYLPESPETTKPFAGLGDAAYFTTGAVRQALTVLHGGAVLCITVDAYSESEDTGAETDTHAVPRLPPPLNPTALRNALPQTMRHLMSILSS